MKFEDDMSNPVEVMINQTQKFGKAICAGLVTINDGYNSDSSNCGGSETYKVTS